MTWKGELDAEDHKLLMNALKYRQQTSAITCLLVLIMCVFHVLVQSLITVTQIQHDTSGHLTGLLSDWFNNDDYESIIQCLRNAFRFSDHCDCYCAALFLLALDTLGKEYSSTQLIT